MSKKKPHPPRHLPGLDGLRALCVLSVIASHSGLAPLGGLGVNTFFVLSGFLITWLLLEEWNKSSDISLKNFYVRRVLRIFPAYYVFIIITISADLILDNPQIKPAIIPALTYTVNYFNVIYDHPGLSVAHAWSLAIEEQFYLIWPALLIYILRKDVKLVAPILLLIILASMTWRSTAWSIFEFGSSYVYNAFETRVDSLASGCLLAVLFNIPSAKKLLFRHLTSPVLSILAFSLVIGLHLFGSDDYRYMPGYTVSSLLAAIILVQIMSQSTNGIWQVLENPVLKYMGVISYPMYLWHGRCIELTGKIGITAEWPEFIVSTIITIAVASGSYYIIEKPFLRMKSRFYSS